MQIGTGGAAPPTNIKKKKKKKEKYVIGSQIGVTFYY